MHIFVSGRWLWREICTLKGVLLWFKYKNKWFCCFVHENTKLHTCQQLWVGHCHLILRSSFRHDSLMVICSFAWLCFFDEELKQKNIWVQIIPVFCSVSPVFSDLWRPRKSENDFNACFTQNILKICSVLKQNLLPAFYMNSKPKDCQVGFQYCVLS